MNLLESLGIEDICIETKICSKCGEDLPLDNFSKASGGNYLRSECKSCANKLSKEREELKKLYPLKDPLNHICPICEGTYEEVHGRGGKSHKDPWVIDHDHNTGKYRGYICHSCNRALGVFHTPDLLINAELYLRQNA